MTSEHERAVEFLLRFVRDKQRDVPMSQEAQHHIEAIDAAKPLVAPPVTIVADTTAHVPASAPAVTGAEQVPILAAELAKPAFLYENAPKPAPKPNPTLITR